MRRDCEHYKTCGMEYCNPEIERMGIECPEYMPKMKPILCNTEMVHAILDGRKTQTRRVVKFPEGMTGRLPENGFIDGAPYLFYPCGIKRPKYQVGDILYVRETFCELWKLDSNDRVIEGTEAYYYAADGYNPTPFNHFPDENGFCGDRECPKWSPSIHMPKEAARIFLKVTNVRVEQLKDVTEDQLIKEGIRDFFDGNIYKSSMFIFMKLFQSTYPNCNCDTWVWVYEFERCEKEGICQ